MMISGQDEIQFGARVYEAWVRQRLTDELAIKVGLFRRHSHGRPLSTRGGSCWSIVRRWTIAWAWVG